MKPIIPTNRPVNGADLDALRKRLSLSTSDACWLYGLSMSKWTQVVKKNANQPLKKATLALMARALSARQDLCPIPKTPTVDETFALVHKHREYIDKKRFAIMFGCEASTGYRWMTVKTKVGTIQKRLFMILHSLVTGTSLENRTSLKRKLDFDCSSKFITQWEGLVEVEAESRGIKSIFQRGCWTNETEIPHNRRMKGEDIDAVRATLGLSTMDACWLFGMSMSKWTEIVKKNGNDPLKSPSLSLLVRILLANPEACPLGVVPDPMKIFNAISVNQRGMDKKRMSIMFGCEGSSGYRWLTVKSNVSPSLHRIFKIFTGWYGPSMHENNQATHQGLLAISEWDKLVEVEASVRGVANVFAIGRWAPQKK